MNKSQFKKQYSAYRLALRNAFDVSKESFLTALNSNQVFRVIHINKDSNRPVSAACFLALNK